MSATPFQGPIVRNLRISPVDGYVPPAKGLNGIMVAQASYVANGLTPTSATSANPPVVTQPALKVVVNTGTAVAYGVIAGGPQTLPTGSVAQDVYADVTVAGAWTFNHGAPGYTPPAPAANTIRIWKVTTGAGNVGVVLPFIDLSNRSPFNPALSSVMATDGSNAGAVVLHNGMTLQGLFTPHGGLTIKSGILDKAAGETISLWYGSPIVSIGGSPTVTVTPLAGSNSSRGRLVFSLSSVANLTGLTLYAFFPGLYNTWGGRSTAQDAATAALGTISVYGLSTALGFAIPVAGLSASTNYTFCYRTFTS